MSEALEAAVIEHPAPAALAVHRPAPLSTELTVEAASAEEYAAASRAERDAKDLRRGVALFRRLVR